MGGVNFTDLKFVIKPAQMDAAIHPLKPEVTGKSASLPFMGQVAGNPDITNSRGL